MKSKITLKGSALDGYVLRVEDQESAQDIAIMHDEIPEIIKVLSKKIKHA